MDTARRSTKAQQDILDVLSNSTSALSQSQIMERVTSTTDRITIYRILNRFCEDGVVHKVVAPDATTYYALCKHRCSKYHHVDTHFHINCTMCGGVFCTNNKIPASLIKHYHATDSNAVLIGVCDACSG
jgi:Fur family transcriptional regulator, ferric uptake regulator